MHDVGHSGLWSLVALVPGVNFILGLYALFAPGQEHDNDYGLSPLQSKLPSPPPVPVTSMPPSIALRAHVQQPALATVIVNTEAITQVHSAMNAIGVEPMEEFWAQALHECESATMKAGLWAKAFADASGDDKVAKAAYIRLRATQLQAQYAENQHALKLIRDQEFRVEQERQKAQEAELAALLAQMTDAQRANSMLPEGRCPACDAVIPLASVQCPECSALFTPDSHWNVKPLNRYEAIAQTVLDSAEANSLRTKEEKESESARSLLFLGILLLLVGLAVANS